MVIGESISDMRDTRYEILKMIFLCSVFSAVPAVTFRMSYIVCRMSRVPGTVAKEGSGNQGLAPRCSSGGGAEPLPCKMIISVISVLSVAKNVQKCSKNVKNCQKFPKTARIGAKFVKKIQKRFIRAH